MIGKVCDMQPINPGQLKALNTLVSKLNISKDDKAIIVEGFSAGRCTSSKDLYANEAVAMIRHLKSLDPDEAKADRMRKKIISLAHEMNWRKDGRADMRRIDNWCRTNSYLKKSLDRYIYTELPKLVSQFEMVYKSFLKSI